MSFKFRIDSLAFERPDDAIRVLDADIIVLVGPNNSGKSQALRDISVGLEHDGTGLVVKTVMSHRKGTAGEVTAYLRDAATVRPRRCVRVVCK
jgi:ABC-type sulfate/molybdate transport systems ATPase subunit